jgi:hypothetical protein
MSGPDELRQAVQRKGSFIGTLKAVVWSFLGVRRGADYEKDLNQLNPVHLIIAGLLVAALFIGSLVLLVKWVIGSGVAA